MVARVVRDDEAAGSNPVTPTTFCIFPRMPVVSLRSTTGYKISSLRDGGSPPTVSPQPKDAGGIATGSRWLSEATPPVSRHHSDRTPAGVPEQASYAGTPAGVPRDGIFVSGGVASLNHRLQDFIPPGWRPLFPTLSHRRKDAGGIATTGYKISSLRDEGRCFRRCHINPRMPEASQLVAGG